MANKNMTYDEIIKILQEKMANGEIITIEELDDFVRNCSVVDEFAAPDAITLFYGGVSDEFMYSIVAQNSSKFRVIKRTDAYKLLNSDTFNIAVENAMKHKYPDLDYKQIQSIISDYFNAAGSISATGEKIEGGKWAVVSERFAADTKGDAYAFVFDANGNRIFDMDELPSWLENVFTRLAKNVIIYKQNIMVKYGMFCDKYLHIAIMSNKTDLLLV